MLPVPISYLQVQAGALDLLSQRLPNVSTKMRQDIVPTIIKIVVATRNLLVSKNDSLAPSAFRALRSIALTLCTGEESSLTETISPILTAIRERTSSSWALAAMSPLP
jgi:U3 small nucleolar RNA-associated protein 10